jgi:hypothetical protein
MTPYKQTFIDGFIVFGVITKEDLPESTFSSFFIICAKMLLILQ